MARTGVYQMSDLLATRLTTAVKFGLDEIANTLRADLAAHNAIFENLMSDLVVRSTDVRRLVGASSNTDMYEVDEFGRAPTQKGVTGAEVGFPLRMFQYSIGWTRKFLQLASPADMAQQQLDAERAHVRALSRAVRRALFANTNYTFPDFLVDNVNIPVKRLLNADSMPLPLGPNGEEFNPASHQHYLATAGAAATADELKLLIRNVMEHGHTNALRLYINLAQEPTVRAMTGPGEFMPYVDSRIVQGTGSDRLAKTVDATRVDNRAIGIFAEAEVWTKAWMPPKYYFAFDAGDSRKPIVLRTRNGSSALALAAEFDTFPLQADTYDCEFGAGVWQRTNGAILYEDVSAAWADAQF